jgi:dihydrofolate reductase
MRPQVSFVVAMSENRVIGRDNQLPWRIPADMAFFKRITMGKPIVMGRKNYEDIGRPLPGRHNIVMTRQSGFSAPGCTVVDSPEAALQAAGAVDEVMIIGGDQIYRAFMDRVDVVYLTIVHAQIEGDVFLSELSGAWRETERREHPAGDDSPYPLTFLRLER